MEKSADPKSKGSDGPWSSVHQSKHIKNYAKYREEGDGSKDLYKYTKTTLKSLESKRANNGQLKKTPRNKSESY